MKGAGEPVENEWYIVRYSGETPEIAYHSAIYFLTRDRNGPGLSLDDKQFERLKAAAVARYSEIVLRDMLHANCTSSSYRGIARSIVNYNRFCLFCTRQQLDATPVRNEAASALTTFVEREIAELRNGRSSTLINCSYQQLRDFASLLEVEWPSPYEELRKYCPQQT